MQETLLNKRVRIRARRTPGPAMGLNINQALCDSGIGQGGHRELIAPQTRTNNRFPLMSKANVVLIPGNQFAFRTDRRLHIFKAAHSKEVLMDIVRSSPGQLHGTLGPRRDRHRLCYKIMDRAPAKAAAHSGHIHRDLRFRKTQQVFRNLFNLSGELTRHPNFHSCRTACRASSVMNRAIHRFHADVCDVGEFIKGF